MSFWDQTMRGKFMEISGSFKGTVGFGGKIKMEIVRAVI